MDTERLLARRAPQPESPSIERTGESAAEPVTLQKSQQLLRVISHLAIWVVVLYPVVAEVHRGWRALQDDATIAIRSYQVLSLHPTLLGQYSTLSIGGGHVVYDPGPLQYWLLAVPVHLDGTYGALWGAALISGLVLSLAVEALWRTGHRWACGVFGVAVVNVAYLVPRAFAQPTWNPYFAFSFAMASIVLAWVVASGSLGWWPWLVFTGSVAVQTEAFFAFLVLALLVGAPLVSMAIRRADRYRWLVAGGVVGVVCWLPTIIQQLFDTPGNLSLILNNQSGDPLGISYGLRALAFAGSPHPIWTRGDPALYFPYEVPAQSALVGFLVLVMCAGIGVLAWRTGRTALAALAAVGLLCSVGTVAMFANPPTYVETSLFYLNRILWPIGFLIWSIVLWGVVELALVVVAKRTVARSAHSAARPRSKTRLAIALTAAVSFAVVLLAAVAVHQLQSQAVAQTDEAQMRFSQAIATAVERAAPRGNVSIAVPYSDLEWFTEYAIVQGAAWKLVSDGWSPSLPVRFSEVSGIFYVPHTHGSRVELGIVGSRFVVHRVPGDTS